MRILIVDDTPDSLYMLESLLRGYNYDVDTATNGIEALEKLSQNRFDMIISDILMPQMDGFQLCREVKKDTRLKDTAFVFYTATYTDPKDRDFALSLGAERFIVKPVEPDKFIEMLQEIIKSHEAKTLRAPKTPIEDEEIYLKEYNERLIKKMEDKMLQMEQANKTLSELEEKYRSLIDNANDAIVVFTESGYIRFVNPKFCQMTGYPPEEIEKLHFSKIIHPDDLDICMEYFKKRMRREKSPRNYEIRLLTKTGKIIYMDNNVSPIITNGNVVGVQAIMRDVTKRKQREEEINFKSLLLDNATDSIFVHDLKGKILYVNKAAYKTRGYSKKELLNMSLQKLDTPEYAKLMKDRMENLIKTGESTFESAHLRKDKSIMPVEVHARLTEIGGKKVVISIARDITLQKKAEKDRKKLQTQLLQAQKMEAIGVLAGGVAHDFNNLLTVIQGYSDFLIQKLKQDDPIYQILKEIRQASVRAADLTHQLLLFSRREPMARVPINLNTILESMAKMITRLIGENIIINISLDPNLWAVSGDTGTLEQVIMNIAVNARDAMPEGGSITFKTENITLDETYCNVIPDARPGRFICLSIEDTGIGINNETIMHIFDPFFSTKEVGKGTGLGLSVAYGIIKQHEGWINVYSEHGQGTIFKIYLPAADEKPIEKEKYQVSIAELKGNGERILLVEDEMDVRKYVTKILKENGYTLFTAANAKEAIDIFNSEGGKFYLLFTDVVLPGKSGVELATYLLSLKPELKVLFASGYLDQKSQYDIIHEKEFPFIRKPYTLSDLLKAIKKILSSD